MRATRPRSSLNMNGLPTIHPGEFLRETLDDMGLTQAAFARAVQDNPDLPPSFIAECLLSMAEAREDATPFVPRSTSQGHFL